MFDGIMFVEFCNERGGAEDGSGFTVAIKGATQQDLKTLEESVYAAAETMTRYDSLEERVREIADSLGLEYETIYPDRYITIC